MRAIIGLVVLCACSAVGPAAAAPATRPAAPWPPPEGKLRVIIDADAANEVDDQYALALALGRPDRLQIEGIVAAHYGDFGGPNGIEKSEAEVHRVLEKAGMAGKVVVKRGADPIAYANRPTTSDGIDFIIERAKTATPEDPIWLVLLGPATDAVAALKRDPSIADRLVVFWHGRSAWPNECLNFNAINDAKAARLLFDLPCRFVLFDTGTHLTIDPAEGLRRFAPRGPLGAYLCEIRNRKPEFASPKKGIFDLGDIAALVDPSCAKFERIEAPAVTHGMRYDFKKPRGQIVRISDVDAAACFQQLEDALGRLQPKP